MDIVFASKPKMSLYSLQITDSVNLNCSGKIFFKIFITFDCLLCNYIVIGNVFCLIIIILSLVFKKRMSPLFDLTRMFGIKLLVLLGE